MKYIIRVIALPFWAVSYFVFALYLTFKGFFKMCYGFVVLAMATFPLFTKKTESVN
jgi:hypothetical protein